MCRQAPLSGRKPGQSQVIYAMVPSADNPTSTWQRLPAFSSTLALRYSSNSGFANRAMSNTFPLLFRDVPFK